MASTIHDKAIQMISLIFWFDQSFYLKEIGFLGLGVNHCGCAIESMWYLTLRGDVKIHLPRPSVYHSLSPPAATGGLEQLYLNMIDLNV